MAEGKISYLARNYDDYRKAILKLTREYYPDLAERFNDASVGSWFVDVFADVADNLSYNIDRAYQETSVDSASERASLLDIARTNGLRVPGPKAAIVEVEISCEIPMAKGGDSSANIARPNEDFCPIIRRGTLFTNGSVTFELTSDVNFREQFDGNGISDRQVIPKRNSNGVITAYTYKKLAIAAAGQSKIYKKAIESTDVKPFMEVLLTDNNILGVESIIVKEGSVSSDPFLAEFYVDEEEFDPKKEGSTGKVRRFFEVDNLIDQYRYGHVLDEKDVENYYQPKWEEEVLTVKADDGSESSATIRKVAVGKWKRLKNKFTTEFANNGNLKITFGKGLRNVYGEIPEDATEFTQYLMSRMQANDYMGVLPEAGKTMYVLYRVGGGEMSNIAKDTLTTISYLDMRMECPDVTSGEAEKNIRNVRNSLRVTNTTPSYGGKDAPSDEEIRQMIKHNFAAQNRCVTLHDYEARVMEIPPMFGCPFRVGVIEENNKVEIYTLGLDSEGKLMSALSEQVGENLKTYLSGYRMLNDFVEIRSGKVINISFEVDLFVDKSYDKAEVVKRVIELIEDYMDIRRHHMGEDIFIGDLEKEISKLDGVQNLVELRCYNKVDETGQEYSSTQIAQELIDPTDCRYADEFDEITENSDLRIDLKSSDKVLYSDANAMFEVKYPDKDIKVRCKTRQ